MSALCHWRCSRGRLRRRKSDQSPRELQNRKSTKNPELHEPQCFFVVAPTVFHEPDGQTLNVFAHSILDIGDGFAMTEGLAPRDEGNVLWVECQRSATISPGGRHFIAPRICTTTFCVTFFSIFGTCIGIVFSLLETGHLAQTLFQTVFF